MRWRWVDPPGTLEFYARHRMTNERWAVIAPDGTLSYKELWDDIGLSDSAENAARDAAVRAENMAPRGPTESQRSTLGDTWSEADSQAWACNDEPWQRSPLLPADPESSGVASRRTVPTDISDKHAAALRPSLAEGEQLLAVERVQLVAGTRGLALPGAAIGNRLARADATHGDDDSTARTIPERNGVLLMAVTDRRLLLRTFPPAGKGEELWEASRSAAGQVERRPRRQLMARFKLHFADGSSAAFITFRRAAIERLASALADGSVMPG